MENKLQKMVVTNNDVTVSHLQAYCDLFGVSQDEVSDEMVKSYFTNHQFDLIQQLIEGCNDG